MRGAVIDASVAVKWIVAEEHSRAALRLLETCEQMVAPAHWLAEASNAIWAKCRRGELSAAQGEERVATLASAPVAPLPLEQLLEPAFAVALRMQVTVYDALYVAAAMATRLPLVTADRKLLDAARNEADVRWVEESEPAPAG